MDLFEYMSNTAREKDSPLASRLRPATLDEVVGQSHIIGSGTDDVNVAVQQGQRNGAGNAGGQKAEVCI